MGSRIWLTKFKLLCFYNSVIVNRYFYRYHPVLPATEFSDRIEMDT